MKRFAALCLALTPALAAADGLTVSGAMVPLAPPSAMAHAGYFTLENTGTTTRSLVGVTAAGYAMAHLHQSADAGGVATMSMVHQIDIAPGQSVAFAQGGLHVMLMRPKAPLALGGTVPFTLEFANGETVPVSAEVMKIKHSAHSHGS
jgi:copper(I)-binding protein